MSVKGSHIMDEKQRVSVRPAQIFLAFLNIGATSFGGGAVAYLRDHLVSRHKWLDEDDFLAVLEIGETVPGLISTNVAVIVGSRLSGVPGAIAAALGMIIPGAIVVSVLGVLYGHLRHNPDVGAALAGVGAAAVGLILAVSLQIGSRALRRIPDLMIVSLVFALVGVWHVSLVPVLAVTAPIAIWIYRPRDHAATAAYHAKRAAFHARRATQAREQADDRAEGAS